MLSKSLTKGKIFPLLFSFLVLTFFFLLPFSFAAELSIGEDDSSVPIVVIQQPGISTSINYSTINVNNSQYWNGNANEGDLEHNSLGGLDGGSANQYYHLNQSIWQRVIDYAFAWITSDGLEGLIANISMNVSNNTYVPYDGATKNVNLGNQNLSAANIYISLGGQAQFQQNDTNVSYFMYNVTSKRLELWVNGKIQQDWGNSTTIYGTATFEADAFFKNMSGEGLFINTNVLVDGYITATYNVTGQNIFAGNICYSDGTNCTSINSTVENLTLAILANYYNKSDIDLILQNYLNKSEVNLTNYYNKTEVDNITATLGNASQIGYYEENINIVTSSGTGGGISTSLIGFLITEIRVTPVSSSTSYKFQATTGNGSIIDKNRMTHIGVWDIEKNYAINDYVVANITNANPDDTFEVKIIYVDNFR